MLVFLFRKMISEKRMALCLLAGFVAAVGVICAVPIYTDASLQRLLVKDMEQYQQDAGSFPGEYNVSAGGGNINELAFFANARTAKAGLPVVSRKAILRDSMLYLIKDRVDRVKIAAMSDFAEHAVITSGRMCSERAQDGVIETVATENALKTLGISIGEEYQVSPADKNREKFTVVITGVFEPAAENDIYWSEKLDSYLNILVADYGLYLNELVPSGIIRPSDCEARYGLDYRKLDMNTLGATVKALDDDFAAYKEAGYAFEMNAYAILTGYAERAASLSRALWTLQIPVTVMLGFYLFMVSRLNLERERNEIALLKSRGASVAQIFAVYAAYIGVTELIALIAAPFVGLMLCRFLGVSDGFLEFVNRRGLPAKITPTALICASGAAAAFFLTAILPVIPASRLSIVEYKQSKAKAAKLPLWEKAAADVIMIFAGLFYARYYDKSVKALIAENRFNPTGEMNPLLFIFASVLIMGLGLLYLRIYPWILKLVYAAGNRFWNPAQYLALGTVKRNNGGERFLMLFLVITFSLGIFSANTARAVNNNKRDMIYYSNGADVRLSEYKLESAGEFDSFIYKETDFSKYENLAGVETATRVLRNDAAKVSVNGGKARTVSLMAVEPDKFARTAWFRDDLLPVHWYNYCNALVDARNGVIVSDSMNIALGEVVNFKWGKSNSVNAPVIAIVDRWPGINPYAGDFAVMNYNYIRSITEPEPFEVWLNMQDGASSEVLYADIKAKRLPIKQFADASQLLIAEKTDPRLQGVNGALTLGFTVTIIMTVIGFLIYWIMSIKNRTLQFGVVRAMGMSYREIISVILYEQILISGASIASAFVIGGVASSVFVPLFRNMYAVSEQALPFYVSAARSDYVKLYALIIIMLALGFVIIGGIIKKTSINKALKLGED